MPNLIFMEMSLICCCFPSEIHGRNEVTPLSISYRIASHTTSHWMHCYTASAYENKDIGKYHI